MNDLRIPSGVVIDALRESDAPRCAALERLLFPGDDPWTAAAFRDELRAGHAYLAARSLGGAPEDTARSLGGAPEDTARSLGGAREHTAHNGGAPEDTTRTSGGVPDDTARRGAAPEGPRRDDTMLVGYGGLAVLIGPPRAEAEVHTIGVDPACQGRGIGRALLRGLLAVADPLHATVFLEVRTDNDAARALYESEGFTVVGLRRRYYRPSGADAHTMRRDPR